MFAGMNALIVYNLTILHTISQHVRVLRVLVIKFESNLDAMAPKHL
jgi:hypothetical protein